MQTLGNLVFGAVLAGVSLAPTAWADARVALGAPISQAAMAFAGTGETGVRLDRVFTAAEGVIAQLPGSARLRH